MNVTETSDEVKKITETSHAVEKRSFNDREIFTRRGAYHVFESRLNA
jgi:hypothetical protein